jgi:parallel beta-helix repeat protein/predicted outer membrane repeat protein
LITGCTIKDNSAGNYGGGIYCSNNANPAISTNLIMNNSAGQDDFAGQGAGIFCRDSSPDISGNIITGNICDNSGFPFGSSIGGGIYLLNSNPSITNNDITENEAYSSGGIGSYNSSPSVMNCTFSDNYRGGMCSCDSSTTVINCIFSENAHGSGGGISNSGGSTTVVNCTFVGNEAHYSLHGAGEGGGIVNEYGNLTVDSCFFIGNSANFGGGICNRWDGSTTVTNCTFSGNSAVKDGGGIYNTDHGCMTVFNTILWKNDAFNGPEIWIGADHIYPGGPSYLGISNSDVEGGQFSVYVDPFSTLNWESGMIDSDPLFVDQANGDFHLTFNSPCRASGDNTAVTGPTDFEGDPRIAYGTVDMGADEFYTHLYWTGDATPGGNVEIKFVGLPGTTPVGLCIGTGVLDPPIPSMWGDWYLAFPIIGPVNMGSITSPEGVLVVPGAIPMSPPAPYTLPMQALIGAELSNLSILEFK